MVQGKMINTFISKFQRSLYRNVSLSDSTSCLCCLQPIEVWSKCGRRGRIREPVGTHGKSIS